jgi:hypothetical protein
MHFSPARLATAVATLALIALPGSAFAQSNPPQNPPSQPPTQTQPAAQPPAPREPPAASSDATAASGQVDATTAKEHLTEARDALSQVASMPGAARLQGDARTKVSALISNFNALITTQADWRASYGKVNDSLTALLGPDTTEPSATAATTGAGAAGTAGTTSTTGTTAAGTTGTTAAGSEANAAPAAGVQLDPAIRAKLVEFRTHLKEFEKSAGGAQSPSPAAAPASRAMPAAAATESTSNPSNPASEVSGATGTSGAEQTKPGATGTSGTTPAAAPAGSADQSPNATAQSELAAIDAILASSKTGALTKVQTDEVKRHLEALRALLK